MPPKDAKGGVSRAQTGDLNGWLKTSSSTSSSRGDSKRTRPDSDEKDSSARSSKEKKLKSNHTHVSPSEESAEPASLKTNSINKEAVSPASHSNTTTTKKAKPTTTLTLTARKGDIFDAAPGTLLIHACNCQGSWSAGIAAAFKGKYPRAFEVYAKHCRGEGKGKRGLVGRALLIPPVEDNDGDAGGAKGKGAAPRTQGRNPSLPSAAAAGRGRSAKRHFIGCLFTSDFYGRGRDSPEQILQATGPAMRDLLGQVREWNRKCDGEGGEKVGEVRMCKINSGLFGVDWEETVEVLEGIETDGDAVKEVLVVERGE